MKQVIVVNQSLDLPVGKLAAQVAHGSVAALLRSDHDRVNQWLAQGMPKIVLQGESMEQLEALCEKATAAAVTAQLIRDAGKTVVAAGTVTCLALGPDEAEKIDAITGKLKLL